MTISFCAIVGWLLRFRVVDWYRYAFSADRGYAADLTPVLGGYLYGKPEFVVDGQHRGFRFDGEGQYGELCPRAADLGEITVDITLKWESRGEQTIFDFGCSSDHCLVLKTANNGNPELIGSVAGKTVVKVASKETLLTAAFAEAPKNAAMQADVKAAEEKRNAQRNQVNDVEREAFEAHAELAALTERRNEAENKRRTIEQELRKEFDQRPGNAEKRTEIDALRKQVDEKRAQVQQLEKEAFDADAKLQELYTKRNGHDHTPQGSRPGPNSRDQQDQAPAPTTQPAVGDRLPTMATLRDSRASSSTRSLGA